MKVGWYSVTVGDASFLIVAYRLSYTIPVNAYFLKCGFDVIAGMV